MKKSLALAAAALCFGAGVVEAAPRISFGGFSVESVRTAGTGALAGFDVIRFIGINNATGETAGSTKLQSINITLSTPDANLKLDFRDLDGDGENDANLLGSGINPNNPIGSYVRNGIVAGYNAVTVQPTGGNSDPNGDFTPDRFPSQMPEFTSALKQMRVVGFHTPGASPVATGAGTGFAAAVVPTGATARVVGTLAAEAGSAVNVDFTDAIPEPTALAFVGLGGMALLNRRRKA